MTTRWYQRARIGFQPMSNFVTYASPTTILDTQGTLTLLDFCLEGTRDQRLFDGSEDLFDVMLATHTNHPKHDDRQQYQDRTESTMWSVRTWSSSRTCSVNECFG